jgi:hypothetical protein
MKVRASVQDVQPYKVWVAGDHPESAGILKQGAVQVNALIPGSRYFNFRPKWCASIAILLLR